MKQSTFKQILLLVILFFAGIGSAFGEDAFVIVEMNYDYVAEVSFWNKHNERVASACISTIGGNLIGFETGETYRMEINVYNQDYEIQSISVDGTDVTNVFQTNNQYDIEVNKPNSHVVVTLVKNTKHVTVNRMKAGTEKIATPKSLTRCTLDL